MVGAAPIFLMWCFSRDVSGQWRAFGWSLAVGASAICIGFVGWRWWLIYRAAMLDADRAYDERIKYTLPPEYRDTESAGEVRRRKARERLRKG